MATDLFAKPSEPLLVPDLDLSFLDRMRLFWMLEEGRWVRLRRTLAARQWRLMIYGG